VQNSAAGKGGSETEGGQDLSHGNFKGLVGAWNYQSDASEVFLIVGVGKVVR